MRELPVRKNIRLKGYDYSRAGCYFVTICVNNRHEMLGRIDVGAGSTRPEFVPSDNGLVVIQAVETLRDKYETINVDCYVVMPNHFHCIISLSACDGRVDPAPTLAQILGYFKYTTTKDIGISGFWQRSYHDHIIRDEEEYQRIWQYIDENPARWQEDRYFVSDR